MGIGIWELVIILAIVLVIFGAKRLKSIGSDLGGAIKSFKQSMKEEATTEEDKNKGDDKHAATPSDKSKLN